jgi:hypothetical protein
MKTVELLQEAKTEYWGYHLILDCAGCNDAIADKDQIKAFLKALVKDIKNKAFKIGNVTSFPSLVTL